jgi:hypothetical protein
MMKSFFYMAVIVLSLFLSAAAQPKEIKLAQSSPVKIDGKIEESEWKDSQSFDLTGGGKVFFKYDGAYLFVGVRGLQKGWSHLYLKPGEKSEEFFLMHASAALGQVLYHQDKNKLWQPNGSFSWDLRDRIMSAETGRKMDDYLAKNFWVANNNNLGNPTEIEFQVKPPKTSAPTLYLALVYASDAKQPQYFPATLKDDTIKEELVYGNTPNNLKFEPQQWAKVILENKK